MKAQFTAQVVGSAAEQAFAYWTSKLPEREDQFIQWSMSCSRTGPFWARRKLTSEEAKKEFRKDDWSLIQLTFLPERTWATRADDLRHQCVKLAAETPVILDEKDLAALRGFLPGKDS